MKVGAGISGSAAGKIVQLNLKAEKLRRKRYFLVDFSFCYAIIGKSYKYRLYLLDPI